MTTPRCRPSLAVGLIPLLLLAREIPAAGQVPTANSATANPAPPQPAGDTPANPAGLTSREAIEAEFRRDLGRAERARLARLAALAAGQPKPEAAATYEEAFRFAISAGLYNDAEPIAEAVLKGPGAQPAVEVAILAEMVNLVAEANRGAYEESLGSLAAAIRLREGAGEAKRAEVGRVLPIESRLALVNIYIQRLIQAGKYDVARRALTLIRDRSEEKALKSLAETRLGQIDLIGKPAPPIAGTSIGGKPVTLASDKGDVTLVVFWASWCLPNAQEAGRLDALAAAYGAKGFRVLGVNLDAVQDGGVPVETVMPNIRRFLIEHNVRWPSVINGKGPEDFAKAYGVTEIPTNVLVGRDGKVLHLDLGRATLEPALNAALAAGK